MARGFPARPTAAFARVRLEIAVVPTGRRLGRIYLDRYPDPLGYGKTPSRFSDPRRRVATNRFGVLYLGESLKVCFLESVLRDQRDGVVGDLPVEEAELTTRRYAEVAVASPLRLVDLRQDRAVRMGVPSDVTGAARQSLGRAWSLAFHTHPQAPDGVIYPSRLNGQTNVAVYGRAVPKLRAVRVTPLIGAAGLAGVLTDLHVALV